MDVKEAMKHWAAWGRDLQCASFTCGSIEKLYAKDSERFKFHTDVRSVMAFKYDCRVAEKVESKLVSILNKTELCVLVCCEVYGHSLPYEIIARKLHMPQAAMETYRLAALNKFRRVWHG